MAPRVIGLLFASAVFFLFLPFSLRGGDGVSRRPCLANAPTEPSCPADAPPAPRSEIKGNATKNAHIEQALCIDRVQCFFLFLFFFLLKNSFHFCGAAVVGRRGALSPRGSEGRDEK
ncbi:hypothetical protein TW95_gp1127 [Pandoravirus inopinatum]|uniref:Uncharacterized protein n=1 Tax=Pandoravirus inopinatum TaxID=1605721 RepID=A0A0B5JAB9_9VIRU|nr:hypothetical protein TW95_gp1127 [Pandoravirus inopinatum]AJF97861.1 hypothetical protein [Pandoravirus inopinatum]